MNRLFMKVIKLKPTSIRIDEELLKKLKEEAEKESRSVSKHIEYIIKQYYEMRKILNR